MTLSDDEIMRSEGFRRYRTERCARHKDKGLLAIFHPDFDQYFINHTNPCSHVYQYRQIMDRAARCIQSWWMEFYLNPRHPVGLRKINRDYDAYLAGLNSLSADVEGQKLLR